MTVSKKLDQLTQEVRKLIKLRANRPMSEAEFMQQTDSFIVGNAFDIFQDSETINAATLREAKQNRFLLVPGTNGQN
jgi:hypothetical protein